MSKAKSVDVVQDATATMTGGAALARMVGLHSTAPVFGMGGFQLLPFYEGMRAGGMRHILINDERSGAFAADAWARVSNHPGMCDGTLGPGATNLVTGLVESTNGGIPQVVLTGNTHRDHSWKNMTQEARQNAILEPAVKALIRVEQTKRIPELVRRAFAVSISGRPGPVVLDLPEDVTHAEHEFAQSDFFADAAAKEIGVRRSRAGADDIERAAALIDKAQRPIFLVGGGIHLSQAYEALRAFCEKQSIPVAHTISGKGSLPCDHPLSIGLFGRYSRIANDLIEKSDLLIAIGCKLGEIATRRFQLIPKHVPLIQADIVPEEIGRTTSATLGLIGDAKLILEDLNSALASSQSARAEQVNEIAPRMARWRKEAHDKLHTEETPIGVGRLLTEINHAIPDDGILVADGGFAGHWAGLLFDTRQAGRHFIANRGFASIGYGVPGALGAQIAAGNRRVIGLTGDGGFNMALGDLETARREKVPFVLCVINNAASGYVKALQHAVYGEGHYQSSSLSEVDYASVARSIGCHGIRVDEPGALAAALAKGLSQTDLPTVIDIATTRDPARMLPGVDNRTLKVVKGDRPA